MALQINYETAKGVVGNYHRITHIVMAKNNGNFIADIKLETFVNQTARNNGKNSLEIRKYFMEDVDPDEPLYEQAYTYLKTLPEFDGAIDV